jgi:hypothetical protein
VARVRLTTIAVALCGTLGLAVPSLATAGSIGGHVQAEGSGDPIQGVYICPRPEPYAFETNCTETNSEGNYRLDGLPAASYYLSFYTGVNDLNYIPERYDDVVLFTGNGELIPLADGQELGGIDAELAEGGVIEGTATDAETSGPAVNAEVCASSFDPIEFFDCARTGSDGKYAVNGLPTGDYAITFGGGNESNYLRYDWEDPGPPREERVPLAAGSTVTGIDADLLPGAQILGRATEVGTGVPLKGVDVCLYDAIHGFEDYFDTCVLTDANGGYAFRSLEASTYKVAFASRQDFGAEFREQWWNGKSSRAEATPIVVVPPQAVTGIDAHLTRYIEPPRPDPIQVTIIPRPPGPKPPPRKCKKGFHKKKVKGKVRCVRKHKRHGKKAGKGRNGGKSRASR